MNADCIDMVGSHYSAQLKWLDCLFLQKCLQHISDDKATINVVDFSVAPATQKGENYASDIFRVVVRFTQDKSNNISDVSEAHDTMKAHGLAYSYSMQFRLYSRNVRLVRAISL